MPKSIPVSGQKTAKEGGKIESSMVNMTKLVIPLMLHIAHNILSSIVRAGQYQTLILKIVDKLKEGSFPLRVATHLGGRYFVPRFLTPEILHQTIDKLKM